MRKRDELTNPKSCMSRARDDEWTFVLLGRDAAAPAAVRFWVAERLRLGKNKDSDPQIQEALSWAMSVEAEQRDRLAAEVKRLKRRLNHQTDDDAEACRQGLHDDCGADPTPP